MKKILLLGAGLSTTSLINYVLSHSDEYDWNIRIGDRQIETIKAKINNHPRGEAFQFNVTDNEQLNSEVKNSDIVISMLPAQFHFLVAKACIAQKKNMVSASYVSDDIKKLEKEIKDAGILLLMENGLDPGIDHMSAMNTINKIKSEGGKINLFKSFTGGLVAPKFDNNPWNYKFTWNIRNVVLAGQGTSKFIRNGRYKYITHNRVFTRIERVFFDEVGEFEAYANRDSLSYREIYDLMDISTMFRGTLRRPNFCNSWNILVQLGMTDDSYLMEDVGSMTYREFTNSFFAYSKTLSVEEKLAKLFNLDADSFTLYKLRWLGIFSNEKVGLKSGTPAQILQQLLTQKWNFDKDDKDMIVMQHQFEYELDKKQLQTISSLVVFGDTETAMSKMVGLPLAIAVKRILNGEIKEKGIHIPVSKNIYTPILKELKEYNIIFKDKTNKLKDSIEPYSSL